MFPSTILPSPRLRAKYRLVAWLIFGLNLLWLLPLAVAIGLDTGDATGATAGLLIALAINLAWFLPTLWLVDRYFDSLRYELHEDEIVVYVGIWTQSRKHVPYRTITNIAIKRDIFDRFLFNIGTVEVQTAGGSGAQQLAEESLVGLVDYDGVYEIIAEVLRQYRTHPLGPRQAGTGAALGEESSLPGLMSALTAMLSELRTIRALLERER